ncbi:MAG: beta-N-acetylhexosaminidase [Candidatus Korobacteraceae bacterium]
MPIKSISRSGASQDLARLVGQLLIFGFDGTELSTRLKTTISALQPGGLILFARNIESPRQTHALLRSAQRLVKSRMFLCVDMEGGTVDRLRDAVAPAPSVAEVAASERPQLFREHGRVIGKEVCALGFNVDFAPVLDLTSDASRPVMRTRTVSSFQDETILYARHFLRGLRESGVLGCGKHFPGLGEASLDSHQDLPVVLKSWRELWLEDLRPYRTLSRDLPFVMVAHCAYPSVTGDRMPASLSRKWITEVLRRKIGYRGLIISDDLEMGGVLAVADIGDAAVATIRAGADIFLVCHKEENVWRAFYTVLAEAERDRRFRQQVEAAAERSRRFKESSPALNRPAAPPPTDAGIDKLRCELSEFGEKLRSAAAARGNAVSTEEAST